MHRMRCDLAKVSLTLALAALLGQPSTTRADLIRPNATQSFPDLSSDIVGTQSYSFTPATQSGVFQVQNSPAVLALGPSQSSETFVNNLPGGAASSQSLVMMLDANGNLLNNGTGSYSLFGSVTVDGKLYSGLLLQGTPTAFGYASPNPQAPAMGIYDANIKLTGGLLQSLYGNEAYMRIIAETNSTFTGAFNQSFIGLKAITNIRSYEAPQLAPVPEPTAFAVLLACGGAGLAYHRRRTARSVDA
jgi:hypothetical protein